MLYYSVRIELKEYKRSAPIRQIVCTCGQVITKENAIRCVEDESIEPPTYYDCFYCPACKEHYNYDDDNFQGFNIKDFWQ